MYGSVHTARLFYENLSEHLVGVMIFEINPYDICVVNNTMKRKQCTISWHVNDLKISNKSQEMVDEVNWRQDMKN